MIIIRIRARNAADCCFWQVQHLGRIHLDSSGALDFRRAHHERSQR
jgi:hypothetical protein